MKKSLIVFVISFLLITPGFADAPPTWSEPQITSANVQFTAKIQKVQNTPNHYRLSVSAVSDQQMTPLWSVDYDFDGYSEGILFDDGSTFAYVNTWYSENDPVVTIYRQGGKIAALKGKDFNLHRESLRTATSHKLWLSEQPPAYEFINSNNESLSLRIHSIDQQTFLVDPQTGKISSNK